MYRSLLLLVILLFLAPAPLQPVRAACDPNAFLRRVSVSSSGEEGNGHSYSGALSANGRMVGFISNASNLVPDDTNNASDAFVHNLDTCETIRVSVNAAGEQTTGIGDFISLSADGQFVSFSSSASNLVPDDTNGFTDVFVKDMLTGVVERISIGPGGVQSNDFSGSPQISDDGNFVMFSSSATNLQSITTVPGGLIAQAYVHDRQSGLNDLVSVNVLGQPADGNTFWGDISSDGQFVTFTSQATNLSPEDNDLGSDVFHFDRSNREISLVSTGAGWWGSIEGGELPSISGDGRFVVFSTPFAGYMRDMQTGITSPVAVSLQGQLGDCSDVNSSISANGRFITFMSCAGNLIPGDTQWIMSSFVRDLWTGEVRRVALTWDGKRVTGGTEHNPWSSVAAEGDAYIFTSSSDDLLPEDTNGFADVYVTGLPPASPIIPQRNFYTVQNPVLTWAGASNAIRYELQVARTAMFTPPLEFQTTVDAPQQEAEVTLIAGQYFWRVRSCTGPTTCGAWSAVDSFVIELP